MGGKGTLSLALVMIASTLASGQVFKTSRKKPGVAKPECATGAVCFSGEVHDGGEFRKPLTSTLDFVLKLPGGVDVVSTDPRDHCDLSAWIANPPLRAHHETEIDASYDWTAEHEVQANTREFRFPTNCADFNRLLDLSEKDAGKYLAQLNSLAKGHGRLWITDGSVSHAFDSSSNKNGTIEWIKFSVEIELPSSH